MNLDMKPFNARISEFSRAEHGTATVFNIFAIAMFLIIGGIAIDGTNFWRHQQKMQQTADVAAHAGVVEIANRNGSTAARTSAAQFVDTNMPSGQYGNLYADQNTDIEVLHYDEVTNTVSDTGTPNAVRISLHRNAGSGNLLPTFALRVSDIFLTSGQTSLSNWSLEVSGVAALAKFQGCNSTDGIYSKEKLSLSSSNTIGPGYCLHSQDEVWMSQQNTFEPTSAVSMPNLDTCGSKCTNDANPGSGDAAWERNLIMPDIGSHIQDAYDSFAGTGDTTARDAFFSDKYLENSALPALQAVGVNTNSLVTGSIVQLSDAEFEELTDVPEGLIYDIDCKENGNPKSTLIEFGAEKNKPGKNGAKYFTPTEVSNIAIITNCGFEFIDATNANASVLISTRVKSTATITSGSSASIGDQTGGCSFGNQTVVMGLSDMNVPADFTGSNVSFVIDGNIHLSASSSSSTIDHSGVSFHSSGEISIAANHTFNSCNNPPSGMVPALQVIRHVIPMASQVASTL